jgi:hypothetical protein
MAESQTEGSRVRFEELRDRQTENREIRKMQLAELGVIV